MKDCVFHQKDYPQDDGLTIKIESFYTKTFINSVLKQHPTKTYLFDIASNDMFISVFYDAVKHPEGSNYMGAFVREGSSFVIDALPHMHDFYDCVEADDGDVIFSRHRHDFVTSSDSSVSIDGGREYTRILYDNAKFKTHRFQVVKDKLKIVEI